MSTISQFTTPQDPSLLTDHVFDLDFADDDTPQTRTNQDSASQPQDTPQTLSPKTKILTRYASNNFSGDREHATAWATSSYEQKLAALRNSQGSVPNSPPITILKKSK